uniref:Uncharacterized protein LOC105047402 n=1 Tax=Elaeis guineensis var. tenera TaxID=51953 RepID=A0A6J0PJR9_ELAGV|nr:uncharacterized protein LOC105047402 [Elaeis guineensis]
MDFSKKSFSPNSRFGILNPTPSDFKRRSIAGEVTQEADENGGNFHNVRGLGSQNPRKEAKKSNGTTTSSISKKKILAEKNDAPFSDSYDLYNNIIPQANAPVGSGHFDAHSLVMPLSSKISDSGDQNAISSDYSSPAPYDPLINYTSPRPEFLRYNPNRRREILRRMEGDMKNEEEGSGADSSSSSDSKKNSISPLQTSFQGKDVQGSKEGVNDANNDDTEGEEVEVRPWYPRIAWRFFLVLGILLPSFFYLSCMNYAPVPSLQEYGGLEENYLMIRDGGLDQQAHDLNNFPGNFLGTLIGLSNECIDICQRELTCAIDGVKREGLEGNESFDGTELITEKERGALVEDGTLNGGVDLVAKEIREEVVNSNEIEQEAYIEENVKASTDAGGEKVEIWGAESAEVHCIAQLLNESPQVSETELLATDSSVGQDAQIDLCSYLEPHKDFGEEAQVMGNLEVAESLEVPQSKMVSSTLSSNQKPEESEISSNSAIELKWDRISLFASKYVFQLLYSFICLSMIIVFNGLHTYFTKFHRNSTPASHIPPALKPASELALEKSLFVSVKEEEENKGSDSDASQRPLAHLNNEHKFIEVRPPTVELLAEFSVIEATISGTLLSQKVRGGLADSAEESQFSKSQCKMSAKRNPSSSANKVYPSPSESSLAPESTSTGNSTAQKQQRKKDAGDGEEVVKVVTTPLRRSSRLRNRVTSP